MSSRREGRVMVDQWESGRTEYWPPVIDVVVLGGVAASAVAADLWMGRYSAPPGLVDLTDVVEWGHRAHEEPADASGSLDAAAPYPWLAVASTGGAVVGLAVVCPGAEVDHAGSRRVDLEVFDSAGQREVGRRLLEALGPLVTNSRR